MNDTLYRFSSKELHIASGMYYYLYRFYDPNLQRWINRDPIQELGGVNLYEFSANSPLGWLDAFGKGVGPEIEPEPEPRGMNRPGGYRYRRPNGVPIEELPP